MVLEKLNRYSLIALAFLLASFVIFGVTLSFLPSGVAILVAAIPAIPTILISRHYFKKSKIHVGT